MVRPTDTFLFTIRRRRLARRRLRNRELRESAEHGSARGRGEHRRVRGVRVGERRRRACGRFSEREIQIRNPTTKLAVPANANQSRIQGIGRGYVLRVSQIPASLCAHTILKLFFYNTAGHPTSAEDGASRAVASLRRGFGVAAAAVRDGPNLARRDGKSRVAVFASAAFHGTSAAVISTAAAARAARDVARGAKSSLEKTGGMGRFGNGGARRRAAQSERGDDAARRLVTIAFESDDEWDGDAYVWDEKDDDDEE
jgi:hypothetical protein